MREVRQIRYDPDAPVSMVARAAVRTPLLVLARARDRGGPDGSDVDLFNVEINRVLDQMQQDPELTVRYVMELVLALDEAFGHLANLCRRSKEAIAYGLLRD